MIFFFGVPTGFIDPPKGFICTCVRSSSREGAGKPGKRTADTIGFERRLLPGMVAISSFSLTNSTEALKAVIPSVLVSLFTGEADSVAQHFDPLFSFPASSSTMVESSAGQVCLFQPS